MEETRGEQVVFGWAGEATTDTGGAAGHRSATPALRAGRPTASARSAPVRVSVGSPPPDRTPATAGPVRAATVDAPLPPAHELWNVHAAARFLKGGSRRGR